MNSCSGFLSARPTFHLDPDLARKKVIGIGEVAHGSGGLHRLAADVMEQLIKDSGARTILLEAPAGAVARLNRLISAGRPVTANDMADLYYIWRSEENLAFFNRLSTLNRTLHERVQIFGFDVRQPAAELDQVRTYLGPEAATSLLSGFPVQQATVAAFRAFELGIAEKTGEISNETAASQEAGLVAVQDRLARDSRLAPDRRADLQMAAEKLRHWLRMYRAASAAGDLLAAMVPRDNGMFAMAHQLIEASARQHGRSESGPVLVWAHLGHLIFENGSVRSASPIFSSGPLMGAQLRKEFGTDYSVFALMAQTTDVSAPGGAHGTFVAVPNSLESAVADMNGPVLLGPNELRSRGLISVALTDHPESPLKGSFPDITMSGASGFDFALIVKQAHAMREP